MSGNSFQEQMTGSKTHNHRALTVDVWFSGRSSKLTTRAGGATWLAGFTTVARQCGMLFGDRRVKPLAQGWNLACHPEVGSCHG